MPDIIQFKNGSRIVNIYSADGKKLKTEYGTLTTTLIAPITEGTVFDFYYGNITKSAINYVGNLEYTNNGSWDATSLFRIHNPEGYYNSTTAYSYYRKDHLGNIREVWQANKNRTIQKTQYYPSGLPWADGLVPSEQPYKYNGKEFIEMSGLDTYDYGARGYYPASGRFMTVDPLAEKYYSISPYVYCAGNPVKYIDPDGRLLTDFEDGDGNLVKHIDDGSSAVFQQTGTGVNLHYELNGYNPNSDGSKSPNLTSAIQEQQQLNLQNPALQQNAEGYNETHCNQATQNVMKTVDSAIDNKTPIVVNGRANDMAATLSSGKNPNYLSVSESTASKNAQNGGLSIVDYTNPNPSKSGHIATYSVGVNIVEGKIANIGPSSYTGFVPLNGAIGKNKPKEYFILQPNVLPTVTVVGQKR